MLEDIELVKNIKGDYETDKSINELVQKHGGLIAKISSKYIKPLHDSGSSIEEVFDERNYIVYKAALSFKEERKVKFSSYLGAYVRWYCLNKINQHEDWKFKTDEPLDNLGDIPNDTDYKKNTAEKLEELLESIEDKKIREVFRLRFFSGRRLMTWDCIGKKMGVSGQSVNNWAKKGLKLLKARVKRELRS